MNKYKIISFVFLISLTTLSVAQDNTEKKDFLPKAGDISLGFSLNPIIDFAGNLINPSGDRNTINGVVGGEVIDSLGGLTNAALMPTASIMGKYMLTDKIAIRGNLGILIDRKNNTRYVRDDKLFAEDPLSQANVVDGTTFVSNGISLALGAEYRIGKGRVQGFFGASVAYAYTMSSMEYSYGNAITEANQVPSISGPDYIPLPAIPQARTLNTFVDGGAHAVGLIGHVGVECFVAPQISIGLEVSLSAFYSWTNEQYAEFEGYNVFTNQVEAYTDLTVPKATAFVFGTNSLSGNIVMNFYF